MQWETRYAGFLESHSLPSNNSLFNQFHSIPVLLCCYVPSEVGRFTVDKGKIRNKVSRRNEHWERPIDAICLRLCLQCSSLLFLLCVNCVHTKDMKGMYSSGGWRGEKSVIKFLQPPWGCWAKKRERVPHIYYRWLSSETCNLFPALAHL